MGLSPRLAAVVDALPLSRSARVLEIGCGTGAAAAEVARRIETGHVLALDRSAKAIAHARRQHAALIAGRKLEFRQSAIENFELPIDEERYDLAFAVRVGALDGRHPEIEAAAKARIKAALKPGGDLFIDGGTPLRILPLGP